MYRINYRNRNHYHCYSEELLAASCWCRERTVCQWREKLTSREEESFISPSCRTSWLPIPVPFLQQGPDFWRTRFRKMKFKQCWFRIWQHVQYLMAHAHPTFQHQWSPQVGGKCSLTLGWPSWPTPTAECSACPLGMATSALECWIGFGPNVQF